MHEKFCYGSYKIINNNFNINIPGFYWIEWESNNMNIPVLPHHNKINNKLMFTNGKHVGCYWFEEILLFLEMGGIINKIKYGIIFDKFNYVFNDYIDFFTKLRGEGVIHNIFAKLMINSLYGRLGMDKITTHSFFINECDISNYSNFNIISMKKLNNILLLNIEINNELIKKLSLTSKKLKYNVSVASSIASKARIKLYKAQRDVIKNNGKLLYSDTDSIFAAFKTNIIGQKHGDVYWDPEKSNTVVLDAVFISSKTYAIKYSNHEVTKIKGILQNSISFDELKNNFYNNTENIKTLNNNFISKKNLEIFKKDSDKILYLQTYDKRKFISNKKIQFLFHVLIS